MWGNTTNPSFANSSVAFKVSIGSAAGTWDQDVFPVLASSCRALSPVAREHGLFGGSHAGSIGNKVI